MKSILKLSLVTSALLLSLNSIADDKVKLKCKDFNGKTLVDMDLEIPADLFMHSEETSTYSSKILKYPRGYGAQGDLEAGYSLEEVNTISKKMKITDNLGLLGEKAKVRLAGRESTTPYYGREGDIGLKVISLSREEAYQVKVEKFVMEGVSTAPKKRYLGFYKAVVGETVTSDSMSTMRGYVSVMNKSEGIDISAVVLCRLESLMF